MRSRLWRLWLVLSLCWIVAVGVYAWKQKPWAPPSPIGVPPTPLRLRDAGTALLSPPWKRGSAPCLARTLPSAYLRDSLFFVDTTFIRSWRRHPLQGHGSRRGRDRLRWRLVR